MIPNKPIAKNLMGYQVIELLLKGHMVRQTSWLKNAFIRITNEDGFDPQTGLAIRQEGVPIYSECTNGYFMHIGFSDPPFKKKEQVSARSGYDGLNCLLDSDWEDWGFVSSEDFDAFTKDVKDEIRAENKKQWNKAVRAILKNTGAVKP